MTTPWELQRQFGGTAQPCQVCGTLTVMREPDIELTDDEIRTLLRTVLVEVNGAEPDEASSVRIEEALTKRREAVPWVFRCDAHTRIPDLNASLADVRRRAGDGPQEDAERLVDLEYWTPPRRTENPDNRYVQTVEIRLMTSGRLTLLAGGNDVYVYPDAEEDQAIAEQVAHMRSVLDVVHPAGETEVTTINATDWPRVRTDLVNLGTKIIDTRPHGWSVWVLGTCLLDSRPEAEVLAWLKENGYTRRVFR